MKLRIMNDELIKLQIDIDVPRSNHRPGLTMKAFFLFPALYRFAEANIYYLRTNKGMIVK